VPRRPGRHGTKKAGLREECASFGSPAIFATKIRGFPPPSREGFGFIGKYDQNEETKRKFK
jgi:hypothetical protein